MKPSSFAPPWFLHLAAILIAAVQLLPASGIAATLRVPQTFPTIAAAANVAQSGDSILVAVGDYDNEIVSLRSGVVLFGSYTYQMRPRVNRGTTFLFDTGPDTTKVVGCNFTTDPFEYAIEVFTSRASIESCHLLSRGPYFYAAINLDNGGSVHGCHFMGTLESMGIRLRRGTARMTHNLFQSQSAITVFNENEIDPAHVEIKNNTMVGSYSSIYLNPTSTLAIVNNIFRGSSGLSVCHGQVDPSSVRYNDFTSGAGSCFGYGPGNIDADPMFCDAEWAFYLLDASPCIGTGENGENMGAFPLCSVAAGIGETEAPHSSRVSLDVSPNPVRARTEFRVSGVADPAALEIYDSAGRVVDIIRPGRAPYMWEPSSSVRPGVYFVRLRTTEGSATSKFVVLPR